GWAPEWVGRGAMRDKARMLDGVGVVGLVILGWLMWTMWLSKGGHAFGIRFNTALFRGGFVLTDIATLLIIAGVTHQLSGLGRVLGIPILNWIGTRSYGLYLYHWPIYQIIRLEAGKALTPAQFVFAMLLTIPITEASYRYVELPIREGRIGKSLHEPRRSRPADVYKRRRRLTVIAVITFVVVGFAGVSIARAPNECVGQVECDLAAASASPQPRDRSTDPPETETTVAGTGEQQ